jgi:N-methylhydantoinase B
MKRLASGELRDLPGFHEEVLRPGEAIVWINNGGGGYGDPRARDPERVARDVNRKWLSVERAREIYGVAVTPTGDGTLYQVDWDATAALRAAESSAA